MSENRLKALGLTLPEAAPPSFNYVPVTLHGGVAYVAGQLPKVDGEVRVRGKAGAGCRPRDRARRGADLHPAGLACLRAGAGIARPHRAGA